MNMGMIIFIGLSTAGWTLFLLTLQKVEKKDEEIHRINAENTILYVTIQQLRAIKGGGEERIIYRNRPTEIPKGTIDAVKLAMKVSHPDNGGSNEDFIKYNEVYKKLTGKGR